MKKHYEQVNYGEANIRRKIPYSEIPLDVLKTMACCDNKAIKIEMAKNKETPSQILEILAGDADFDIKTQVALNDNTSSNVLFKIVSENILKNEHERIVNKIKNNSLTKEEWEEVLTEYEDVARCRFFNNVDDYLIRMFIASHEYTPKNILKKLATDSNSFVRYHVFKNQNSDEEILAMIVVQGRKADKKIIKLIQEKFTNLDLAKAIEDVLKYGYNQEELYTILKDNSNLPKKFLNKLSKSDLKLARKLAKKNR